MKAAIVGTGAYLPERVMDNHELCQRVPDTSDTWIQEKLGIAERRIAAADEQASDLACKAARKAIFSAGISHSQIDGIICAVGTGDVITPATASFIQQKLGMTHQCWALDVKMACAGTISGIAMARAMVETGQCQHVLVVGTQVITRTSLDWDDRTTAPIFGDGAGAVVVGPAPSAERGILRSALHTDGSLTGIVGQYGGGTEDPLTPQLVEAKKHKLRMNGRAVWDCAVDVLPKVVHEVVEAEGLGVSDVDFVVSHQANKRLLHTVLQKLNIPTTRTYTNVERYGNTVAASAMIALDESVRGGHIKPGDLIVLMAIGAGMSWGAHLIRW